MSRWEWWEKPLGLGLWLVITLITIYSVFAWFDQGGHYNRVILVGGLGSLAFAIPLLLRFTQRMIVPWPLILLIFASLFNHLMGDFLNFYTIYPWFDKVSHFLSSFTVAVIVLLFLVLVSHYIRSIQIPVRLMPWLTLATVGMLGVIWEIFEWFAGFIGVEMQFYLEDTVYDLVTNFIGAMISSYLGYRYVLKNGVEKIALSLEVDDFMNFVAEKWEKRMGVL